MAARSPFGGVALRPRCVTAWPHHDRTRRANRGDRPLKPMGTRLRVAHVMPWDGVGGTEHGALRIARVAREEGFETVFFCLGGAPIVRQFFDSAGFETATWR